jgi:toxin ParE1/3/4
VRRARFVAAARQEFLAEVVYYNREQPGLGIRFAAAVQEATARAVAFPLAGSRASKNTDGSSSKIFRSLSCIAQ